MSAHLFLRSSLALFALSSLFSGLVQAETNSKISSTGTISKGEAAKAKTDETAAEIIDNHLRFRGGSQNLDEAIRKIKSIQSLRVEGTIEERGYSFQTVLYRAAPDKLRMERSRKNLGWMITSVTATDGKSVWSQETSPDPLVPQTLTGSPAMALREDAEFYPIYVDWRENGVVLQYRGEVKIAGQPAQLVKAILPDGRNRFFYFDKTKFYLVCVGMEDDLAGARIEADIYPTKLERIGGVMIETTWVYRDQGKAYRTATWTKFEVNPTLDETLFKMPVVVTTKNAPAAAAVVAPAPATEK
ncbi:MAG: hypothetical protein SFY80_09835 [Verrucomicrobiota bacterium]|nr:hypothetical protein [Verrucomicrobiota bacterium]